MVAYMSTKSSMVVARPNVKDRVSIPVNGAPSAIAPNDIARSARLTTPED